MAVPPENETVLRLPHPYLTPYSLVKSSRTLQDSGAPLLQIKPQQAKGNTAPLPEPLHNDDLFFTEPSDLKSSERPPESNNTPWGRARRSPASTLVWESLETPTLGQAWLLIYVLFTIRPSMEHFRLTLSGPGKEDLAAQLKAVFLAIDHPVATGLVDELLVLRSTFWQGAGSPWGPRTAWIPEDNNSTAAPLPKPLSSYPLTPLENTMTNDASSMVLTWHPRRPAKPRPGSTVYSRWIPHLKENFSMVALDWQNEEHLNLFHTWQNDPRVSQGWNETGTLDQHREYLRKAHVDPHQVTLLAAFEGVFFAYFEVYWGKEDRLGAYYSAGDFDRGRHSLVGDVRYRGPHRVTAWWSSLMHYLFLDDPRTMYIIGEPKYTNSSVLAYDFIHGFGLDKFVDLPHKRSAFVRCSRERFFQLAPLAESEKAVGGTLVGLLPKL
ncbi:acyl-CoA N-acyltransferase [Microdochium trichocladiopsis]|uniref:Acyl-CoA N-acyltransferase n=1 Tax=Microdochium trichocladiopsis TaxID=1682393 RepID=A0A9P8YGP4_9PEZI|nr:acyl-CoA N-acyltransferase [Microdochium trichocladiopsis]KAH7041387.1 acyl-CoA N-acyltransferase [Microdochium trichocladiopsis]